MQARFCLSSHIELEYNPEDENGKKQTKVTQNIRLRKVCYQDEKNRYYEFLTNNFDITAEEVAFLYKKRWGIEIIFKKMKQDFQLHYFYGENVNAIYTQVWCTLVAQLSLTVIQKIAKVKKAFSVVASLVRIHLTSMLDINQLLRSNNRMYNKQSNGPPSQLSINCGGAYFLYRNQTPEFTGFEKRKNKNAEFSRLIVTSYI